MQNLGRVAEMPDDKDLTAIESFDRERRIPATTCISKFVSYAPSSLISWR
jgi:hypothetical protein